MQCQGNSRTDSEYMDRIEQTHILNSTCRILRIAKDNLLKVRKCPGTPHRRGDFHTLEKTGPQPQRRKRREESSEY
jgi:hypothetical protein